jgi:hypothetical protein
MFLGALQEEILENTLDMGLFQEAGVRFFLKYINRPQRI